MSGAMDFNEQRVFKRDLESIVFLHPEVLRISRRETSPPGGKLARNPEGYQSKEPVRLGDVEWCSQVLVSLVKWCGRLVRERGGVPPRAEVGSLAIALMVRIDQVVASAWADECADDVHSIAERMRRRVEPDPPPAVVSYDADRVKWGRKNLTVSAKECAEAVHALDIRKPQVRLLYKWMERGVLPARYGADGRPRFIVDEVVDVLKEREAASKQRRARHTDTSKA